MTKFGDSLVDIKPEPINPIVKDSIKYPIESLGEILSPMALALHEATKAPLELCGQSVLMAAALAAQGIKNVRMSHSTIPLSLFSMVIAESGERKTAADKLAMSPIKAHERNQEESYRKALSSYLEQKEAYEEAKRLKKRSLKESKNMALAQGHLTLSVDTQSPINFLKRPYQNLLGKRMLSYSHLDIVLILEFFQRSETKLNGHYKTS